MEQQELSNGTLTLMKCEYNLINWLTEMLLQLKFKIVILNNFSTKTWKLQCCVDWNNRTVLCCSRYKTILIALVIIDYSTSRQMSMKGTWPSASVLFNLELKVNFMLMNNYVVHSLEVKTNIL